MSRSFGDLAERPCNWFAIQGCGEIIFTATMHELLGDFRDALAKHAWQSGLPE